MVFAASGNASLAKEPARVEMYPAEAVEGVESLLKSVMTIRHRVEQAPAMMTVSGSWNARDACSQWLRCS